MDDTKDTKDIKETGEAASVLSADEQMIQDGFNALLNDYLKSNHRRKVERITKAFNFANQAHAGVKRRFRRTLYNASYRRGSYRMPGDGFGLYLYLLCVIA